MRHLFLGGMTHAHHRLFHPVGRIFPHRQPVLRGHQQGDSPRLPQLERAGPVLVDKCLLHRRRLRVEAVQNITELLIKRQQPRGQIVARRMAYAVGDMAQAAALHLDHAPAEVAQPRVDAQYPHVCPARSGFRLNSTKRERQPSTMRRRRPGPSLAETA
jgi:hypothetical protein